jgi:UDP-N-acetylmuramate dehydrogenase
MQFQEHASLKEYNTFGMDVRARSMARFSSEEELEAILTESSHRSLDRMVLGGGSNIFLTGDVDALVLKNEIMGMKCTGEDEEHYFVTVGAGENWHRFVLFCVENNYAGVENLSLIPGNTGASPMQNIGAYGVEVKDIFQELTAFHLHDKTTVKFTLDDCAFGYRESVFKRKYRNQFAITSVTFRLLKKPVFHTSYGAITQELEKMGVQDLSIKAISDAVIRIRSSKLPDPKQVGNAGSFFKNPQLPKEAFEKLKQLYPSMPSFPVDETYTKVPAGWLIEQCGWKGFRRGDARLLRQTGPRVSELRQCHRQ